jgi:uncharacterized protein YaaW (UPF0174 family)
MESREFEAIPGYMRFSRFIDVKIGHRAHFIQKLSYPKLRDEEVKKRAILRSLAKTRNSKRGYYLVEVATVEY